MDKKYIKRIVKWGEEKCEHGFIWRRKCPVCWKKLEEDNETLET